MQRPPGRRDNIEGERVGTIARQGEVDLGTEHLSRGADDLLGGGFGREPGEMFAQPLEPGQPQRRVPVDRSLRGDAERARVKLGGDREQSDRLLAGDQLR